MAILTARLMLQRAAGERYLAWLSGAALVMMLLVTPTGSFPFRIISFSAVLPSLFLVTGWPGSKSRKGLVALVERSSSCGMILAGETALPSLVSLALCSAAAMLSGFHVPWQFWVVAPLFTTGFTLILLAVERSFRYYGRFTLVTIWTAGITEKWAVPSLWFTEYPGAVLRAAQSTDGTHPDSFILFAILLLLLSGTLRYLSERPRS